MENSINNPIKELNTEKALQEILVSIKHLSDKFDEVLITLNQIKKENLDLKKENEYLKQENTKINKELSTLNTRINYLERSKNEQELEVVGIPERKGENLRNIVTKINEILNIDDKTISISKVERTKYGQKDKRNIIVKLDNVEQRDMIIKRSRREKSKLILKNIDDNFEDRNFFVNEMLNKHQKDLLKDVKLLKDELHIKYVWVNNGEILARKKDGDKVKVINSLNDLEKLK